MSEVAASCPIDYHYKPSDFLSATNNIVDTAYIVGGLYGNLEALHEILRMQEREARAGTRVQLVFNGDHNWFNTDERSFKEINDVVLQSIAIRGNVEAAIANGAEGDCGCNYPDYFNATYVNQSNTIMRALQGTAHQFGTLCDGLNRLPLIRTLQVGDEKIGICHGDAELLSGWGFAAERLSPIGKCSSGDEATAALTRQALIQGYFRDSQVLAFASSHTCLAHAKDYEVDGTQRLIMNNGAAGLPNFMASRFGIVTRVSNNLQIPANSLYGITLGNVRFDAIAVHYNHDHWCGRFLSNWAPGSAAHDAYFSRLMQGPNFDLKSAVAGHVRLATN